MSRKKMLDGGKKDEIINAALKIFMEKGYEETSVRMILDEANAVIGSFYHYFRSKEELFEESIKLYLKRYEERIAAIANNDYDTKSFMELLNLIMNEMEKGIQDYYFGNLHGDKLHWTIQYSLHKVTLQALLPSIQHMIEKALEDEIAMNVLNLDMTTLATIVLQGIEGILHAKPIEELNSTEIKQIRKNASDYVMFLLQILP